MSVSLLVDKSYQLSIIDDVSHASWVRLSALCSPGTVERESIVAGLLTTQLVLQSAIRKIPRVRAVIDDAILQDALLLVRKLITERIDNESDRYDGVSKVVDCLKQCAYVTEAGLWQFLFILQTAGAKGEDVALDLVPSFVRWVRETSDELAKTILDRPGNFVRKSANQEIPLVGGGNAAAKPDDSVDTPSTRRKKS